MWTLRFAQSDVTTGGWGIVTYAIRLYGFIKSPHTNSPRDDRTIKKSCSYNMNSFLNFFRILNLRSYSQSASRENLSVFARGWFSSIVLIKLKSSLNISYLTPAPKFQNLRAPALSGSVK